MPEDLHQRATAATEDAHGPAILFLARLNRNDVVDLPYADLAVPSRLAHVALSRYETGRLRWYAMARRGLARCHCNRGAHMILANLILIPFLNNKIRVFQRRAYGLRDEEYLRLKVLTCTHSIPRRP
jgi:hypothetical protein